jgi:hypothetical protein
MVVPAKIPVQVRVKGKRGQKKIRLVRAESNEQMIARILNFYERKGDRVIGLRISFQIYDPEANGGKGNHAGLQGTAFSLDERSYEELMKDVKKVKALFE